MKVEVVEGDLLSQGVDVIVNAWNRNIIPWWLLLPQGVSGAIKRLAGTGPFREVRRHGAIPLGGAVLTSAGRLPFQGIIHVAGINMLWRASEQSIRRSVKGIKSREPNPAFREGILFGTSGCLTFFANGLPHDEMCFARALHFHCPSPPRVLNSIIAGYPALAADRLDEKAVVLACGAYRRRHRLVGYPRLVDAALRAQKPSFNVFLIPCEAEAIGIGLRTPTL